METFAHFIMEEIGYKLPAGTQLQDISAFSYRYSMYKVSVLIEFRVESPLPLRRKIIIAFPASFME